LITERGEFPSGSNRPKPLMSVESIAGTGIVGSGGRTGVWYLNQLTVLMKGILSNEVYHMTYQSASVMIVDSMKGGGFRSQATRGTLSHRVSYSYEEYSSY
jgi:hypothetical protein